MPSTAARWVTTWHGSAGGSGWGLQAGLGHRASMTAAGGRPGRDGAAATGGSGASPIGYAPPPSGRGPRIRVGRPPRTTCGVDASDPDRSPFRCGRTRVVPGSVTSRGDRMDVRRDRRCVAVVAVALGVLAGCGGTGADDRTAAAPSPPPARTAEPEPPAVALPNLVGKGLQAAEDEAQAAGFFALASHDALGRRRDQVQDREWTVCFQDPAPGLGGGLDAGRARRGPAGRGLPGDRPGRRDGGRGRRLRRRDGDAGRGRAQRRAGDPVARGRTP